MKGAFNNHNDQSDIFVLSQQMENRMKSQYGDEDLNRKAATALKSTLLSGAEIPSNEIPIIDFYPSEDEY